MKSLFARLERVAALILLMLPFVAYSEELSVLDGNYWINGINKAYSKGNYELLFAKAGTGPLEPIMLSHGVIDGESFSHWLYLNGIPSGYFTKGSTIIYFVAGQEPQVVKNSQLPSIFTRLQTINPSELLKLYEAVVIGKQRIAGREAILIRLTAINNDRYSYELGIDEKTGLLMQVQVINPKDGLIESYACIRLTEQEEPNSFIQNISSMDASFPTIETSKVPLEKFNWKLKYLPKGFHQIFGKKYNLAESNTPIEHLIYSDGLVDFSVYRISSIGSMDFPIVKQGETNLYRHQANGREIVIVGDLPLEIEKNIAQGYEE